MNFVQVKRMRKANSTCRWCGDSFNGTGFDPEPAVYVQGQCISYYLHPECQAVMAEENWPLDTVLLGAMSRGSVVPNKPRKAKIHAVSRWLHLRKVSNSRDYRCCLCGCDQPANTYSYTSDYMGAHKTALSIRLCWDCVLAARTRVAEHGVDYLFNRVRSKQWHLANRAGNSKAVTILKAKHAYLTGAIEYLQPLRATVYDLRQLLPEEVVRPLSFIQTGNSLHLLVYAGTPGKLVQLRENAGRAFDSAIVLNYTTKHAAVMLVVFPPKPSIRQREPDHDRTGTTALCVPEQEVRTANEH